MPKAPIPAMPIPTKSIEAGSGVATLPLDAKPVAKAPLPWFAGEVVTKICASALFPEKFVRSTLLAFAHVPPVLVRSNEIVSEECENPSKLLIVWLNVPHWDTFPDPPSLYEPGLNP